MVGGYKILDNGAAEGYMTDPEELLNCAESIGAQEVVLPDVIGDAKATVEAYNALPKYMWDRAQGYMAVIQGFTWDDWMYCLDAYENNDDILSIAFPRILNRDNPYGRREALNSLYDHLKHFPWEIHCLGASHPADEAKELSAMGFIRGIDTSLPVVYGLEQVSIEQGPHIVRKDHFFEVDWIQASQMEVIDDNLRIYNEWCTEEA